MTCFQRDVVVSECCPSSLEYTFAQDANSLKTCNLIFLDGKEKQKAYGKPNSQAVSDPSTTGSQRCLTCQIGRDGVFFNVMWS
ncbi:unnamed protein product [Caenorhabditis auriculariae]|uniref:Uncharacterized protein n=1 Tax=Caenorhabditis auriculariae TaxID=2777116 RepID=A0A8S1HVQ9_9PELO|nr:unnamed protein product [Caenorhabditis auriculariae]